jgi:hypothetical protein
MTYKPYKAQTSQRANLTKHKPHKTPSAVIYPIFTPTCATAVCAAPFTFEVN